ncbi:predicted protein [Histoplasma capsulatum var. duboisii H88]|uniref:Predicted protein n=1 Tax=Ajellomyces capsulatus (strain H88) TaxID=544711 RepID=F0UF94_AJEC8|nr:predicted protein [Histoplasma capsulatum var. duboisii H88]
MIMQQISPLPQKGECLAGLKRTSNVERRLARLLEGFGLDSSAGSILKPVLSCASCGTWRLDQAAQPPWVPVAPQQQPIGPGRERRHLRTWRYQTWDDSRDAEEGNFSGPTTCSIFPVYLSVVSVMLIHSAKDRGENNGQYRVYTALARGRVSQLEAG